MFFILIDKKMPDPLVDIQNKRAKSRSPVDPPEAKSLRVEQLLVPDEEGRGGDEDCSLPPKVDTVSKTMQPVSGNFFFFDVQNASAMSLNIHYHMR